MINLPKEMMTTKKKKKSKSKTKVMQRNNPKQNHLAQKNLWSTSRLQVLSSALQRRYSCSHF